MLPSWISTIFLDKDSQLHCSTIEEKYSVWATVFFLSAKIHRKVTHVNIFIFFSAIFSRPQFVDILLPWH